MYPKTNRSVAYTGILFRCWGGSTNLVEDRGQREVPLKLQMSETRIFIRLLRIYFPRKWEFGSGF
jgi:hypothetical protein